MYYEIILQTELPPFYALYSTRSLQITRFFSCRFFHPKNRVKQEIMYSHTLLICYQNCNMYDLCLCKHEFLDALKLICIKTEKFVILQADETSETESPSNPGPSRSTPAGSVITVGSSRSTGNPVTVGSSTTSARSVSSFKFLHYIIFI